MKKVILLLYILVNFLIYCENRVALVIGNSDYANKPLRNSLNDAEDMSLTLQNLDFDVILLKNASKRDILKGIRDFEGLLDEKSVGLFYYAGHGVQVNNINYLIPINSDIIVESDVEFEGISLNRVLRSMENARTNKSLLFLDACRDNPYTGNSRSGNRGLTVVSADTAINSAGSLIAFATSPGSVAEDGKENNGTFTSALLKYIKVPGLEINQIMTKVRADVIRMTNGNQKPWTNVSLTEEFYFSGVKEPYYNRTGSIELSVYDPADIYVDGRYQESIEKNSRLTLMNIKAGEHIVEFHYPEFIDKKIVYIKEQEITTVESSYENNPMFNLNANFKDLKNVDIYLNDQLVGKTPFNDMLPVNEYNVVFKHPSIKEIKTTISPQSRESIKIEIDDYSYKRHTLTLKGLPVGTQVLIENDFESDTFITRKDHLYTLPKLLISGKQQISLYHPYIEDYSTSINIIEDSLISPNLIKQGDLKIINENDYDIGIKLVNVNLQIFIDEVINANRTRIIKSKKGNYNVSFYRMGDSYPGLEKEIYIDFNNSTEEIIEPFDFSPVYQLSKKTTHRDELLNLLNTRTVTRKNQKILGLSLLSCGLSSIAYGLYGYSIKETLYNDYISAETTTEALQYRNQLENFEITIPITVIGGSILAIVGLIRNLTLTDTDELSNELETTQRDIIFIKRKLEE